MLRITFLTNSFLVVIVISNISLPIKFSNALLCLYFPLFYDILEYYFYCLNEYHLNCFLLKLKLVKKRPLWFESHLVFIDLQH